MSRTVVRASVFLLAISLALMATRAFADKPAKKPGPVDDPFGGEDSTGGPRSIWWRGSREQPKSWDSRLKAVLQRICTAAKRRFLRR